MLHVSSQHKWKVLLTLFNLFLSALYLAPTLTDQLPSWWKSPLPQEKVRLGLDLQGGSHLVLAVKTEAAIEGYLDRLSTDLEDGLVAAQTPYKRLQRIGEEGLQLFLYDQEGLDLVSALVTKSFPELEVLPPAEQAGERIMTVRIPEKIRQELQDRTVLQALETIRNRIDQFGVSEPLVQREGVNHVVVQLPGIKDPQRAIALIGKTARLEFKLLDENIDPNRPGVLPEDVEILMEKRLDASGI